MLYVQKKMIIKLGKAMIEKSMGRIFVRCVEKSMCQKNFGQRQL